MTDPRSSPPSPETPRITMKHFDWCHAAAARFEDLARTEFSGSQWTNAREANMEAARGMRELARWIRPVALSETPKMSLGLLHEMVAQAMLGHKKFCVGAHEHEGGELEYEWIEWSEAFARLLASPRSSLTAPTEEKS